jgi:type IV secretory pathway TraG/TraD family ATPase VirD4
MKKSIIFGRADEIMADVKQPRLIAKRVGEMEVANKNKAQSAKKISKNSKSINYNHTKHL